MTFQFSDENQQQIQKILAKYPAERKKSAVMPLLDLAQRQNNNWVSKDVIEAVAKILEMPEIKVYEVASFYTMYNLKPVGKYLLQFCKTTPCMLRGVDQIVKNCKKKLGIEMNQTTADDLFTLKEVECLGACVNAPVVQINDDFVEDLTSETFLKILDDLKDGKTFKIGSQTGRQCSAAL
ncbi:MAG: NADH-quinone oxidoreductase subunit E [Alphaproteobacteria bacterium RIFCSPLOWO2_01_FULL_40_26]|nr:MAG: NADH-quinone oxidoreductase subunit E [Alphaproteobacteria bacterium RIFCSPHIGHO2_02_FULL_40_34]OFW94269.1 MAG: NADH-quinone oxidoreductase subunit E [Alphaproteobacteria bacterium RIFCSPLOWO2_01_FULL_40_26]OFX09838.1 MAG: NADH-quinone oxidoreductase subunit E [Alphaproteobacteria bacterium RIFCSPLOWO2_02_FULL_40_19]OFX11421.1 MAG: NADH-quinone oxidoreductase subunit E [Alphaproteobacteria bacterium RIFCSPLOWO2_12_FULL_40_11]